MITIQKYVRVRSPEEAWQLNQNKRSRILGSILWLHLGKGSVNTAIDLCDLGLNSIGITFLEPRLKTGVFLSNKKSPPITRWGFIICFGFRISP